MMRKHTGFYDLVAFPSTIFQIKELVCITENKSKKHE